MNLCEVVSRTEYRQHLLLHKDVHNYIKFANVGI